ncbi:unnamed protein product [Rhizoctonia solani]|uniref:Uncharacterized protein n=1 Tax=Rhizoctonia solani TaxID=456999 RepID=A0A8H3H6D5_9AGAM|nr:unnamed protein product [Rhizoctonia solani]
MSIQVPPGASYQASNTMVIARRHLRNLEEPVRIQFQEEWKPGNALFDWYQRCGSLFINRLELRKEHEGPFYHEFVVFRLNKDAGYFRMDRRQRPDENMPLDCLRDAGVEAFDTIEEVTSMNDPLYSASRCLVSLDLRISVPFSVILKACWAIHKHALARVYTLRRYNCYFFARTILMITARSVPCDLPFEKTRAEIVHSLTFNYNWDNFLLQFRKWDKDLHVWGIMHEVYCWSPICSYTTSSIPNNKSFAHPGQVNGAPQLPIWAGVLLQSFQKSLNKFWQDILVQLFKVALPGDKGMQVNLFNSKGEIEPHILFGALEGLFDPKAPATLSREKEWRKHCQGQLEILGKQLEPKMVEALRCPVLSTTSPLPEIREGRQKPNPDIKGEWEGHMLGLFGLEFKHLNACLRSQVIKAGLD